MDKTCKKLLKYAHSDGAPEQFAFWIFEDAMSLYAKECKLPIEEMYNAVQYLISEGWAEYVDTQSGNHSGVKLTHKGVHYKEFLRRERFSKILIPMVVSVLTRLLIDGIQRLLPLILK